MTSIAPTRLMGRAAAALNVRGHLRRISASAAHPFRIRDGVTGWAITAAALAPALACAGWVVADRLQPPSYSPVRQSVSVLAGHAAHDRWLMTLAIFLTACCYLVIAAGLRGTGLIARLLLVVAGAAGIGIAASPEPVHGSTSQHLAWTALGAFTIAVWPIFAGTERPGQRHERLLRAAAGHGRSPMISVAFLGLLVWLVAETRHGHMLGLAERVSMASQTSWPLIVAVTVRRRAARNHSSASRSFATRPSRRDTSTEPANGLRADARASVSPALTASTQTGSSEAAVGPLAHHPHRLRAQPCARLLPTTANTQTAQMHQGRGVRHRHAPSRERQDIDD
jgi:hypothetical membrane protein